MLVADNNSPTELPERRVRVRFRPLVTKEANFKSTASGRASLS